MDIDDDDDDDDDGDLRLKCQSAELQHIDSLFVIVAKRLS